MSNRYLKFLGGACLIFLLYPALLLAEAANYCSTPPFVGTAVKSNVLFVMDFSGSMQFPAYYGYNFDGYYSSKVADCGDKGEVYATYDPNTDYYGYFESDKYYKYNSTGGYWEINPSCTNTDKIGSGSCISGNLLNWLVMTRIDVALKALIGGKANCDTDYCYLRPQGSRRYVRDTTLHCQFFVRPENYSSGNYTLKDILIDAEDYGGTCAIGNFTNRYAKVKIDKDQRRGIVQNNFDLVRFGFMVFASDGRYGEIRYGFHESDLDTLISKFENEVPYYGTPTGEALWEAYDYLIQENNHSYENNSSYINKASERDPYYEELEDGSVVKAWCRKTFIVLISDGEWNGKVDPVKPAYYLHAQDLRADLEGDQTAKIFSLFAFSNTETGENSMKTISAFGSFQEINNCSDNWPYTFSGFPSDSKNVSFPRANCNPAGTYEDCCKEWDEKDSNGIPDTYYSTSDGAALQSALSEIFSEIRKEAASGTSVSVLAERAKKGANMLQAVFYPEKPFGSGSNLRSINWIGYIYTWWLYNSSTATNIREDTIENKALDICQPDGTDGGDYILNFLLEEGSLKIDAYKSKVNGTKGDFAKTYTSLDETHPVWEAGEKLKDENPTQRRIYTIIGNLQPSAPTNFTELKDVKNTDTIKYSELFGDEDGDGIIDEDDETTRLISQFISFADLKDFIYGNDLTGYRSRKVDDTHTWKLGDIVYSTPQIVEYDDYSVVYVGANDGMLHAFRLGKQRYDGLGPYQEVKLCNDKDVSCNISQLGEELWAFIPKNALPYLRALADTNYCHLYYVDLAPYIVQLDTNNDGKIDKRILIGGMRFGGAVGCSGSNCINPPADTCADPSSYDPSTNSCIGLSSYFALDITDPDEPKFLWEFTDKDLGFTYSGPAFIKRNGNYYVMFVSGPTNYQGKSDQSLSIFVLKLRNDFTIDTTYKIDSTHTASLPTFNNAFGGRLFTNGIDYDNDGNTDAVFFGVTRSGGGSTWHGNVLVVKITDDNPQNWDYEKIFTTNEPSSAITAKIVHGVCFGMHYIYFGTGRYFYKEDDPGLNPNDTEYLYGVRIDPCLEGTQNCNISAVHNSKDACSELQGGGPKVAGWKQELEPKQGDYLKERVITNPTITDFNAVFFTTTEPTADICSYGGRSRLWGLNCATGESLLNQNCDGYITNTITGTLFLQLSGGNIEQENMYIVPNNPSASVNPFSTEDNKATQWMTGIPPEAATPFVPLASQKKGKILYWIEK